MPALALIGPILLALAFAVLAWRIGFLSGSGAAASGLLAFGVVAAGWAWAIPGLTFFVLSSLLSRAGRRRKAAAERLAEKGSRRDARQVLANGGVAGALLALHALAPHPALYWGFVGAFAAAAADTWGTEIGTWAGGPTWQVATGRRVLPGTSGGVSLAGTLGAVAGALAVVGSALPFASRFLEGWSLGPTTALVAGAAVGAALLDSVLGATVQARYRSPDGALTERPMADGRPLPLAAGWRGITNDVVNLACTLVGGLVPVIALG